MENLRNQPEHIRIQKIFFLALAITLVLGLLWLFILLPLQLRVLNKSTKKEDVKQPQETIQSSPTTSPLVSPLPSVQPVQPIN